MRWLLVRLGLPSRLILPQASAVLWILLGEGVEGVDLVYWFGAEHVQVVDPFIRCA